MARMHLTSDFVCIIMPSHLFVHILRTAIDTERVWCHSESADAFVLLHAARSAVAVCSAYL